ncbi:MAG: hypothetical protein ACREOP_08260 [Thermodesulfobacteriota bacterium]
MSQRNIDYRNEHRDIWCVKDKDGNIVSVSEVPKGSLEPEQILTDLMEAYDTKDLEIFNITAEETDEHEKKVIETKGRLINQSEVVKRSLEIRAEKKDGRISIITERKKG